MKKFIKLLTPYGILIIYKKTQEMFKKSSITFSDHENWVSANGDATFRLNYPALTPDSVVFDIGGYKGEWSRNIYAKYSPHIYIFEPVPTFYFYTHDYFLKNANIKVINSGLGATTRVVELGLADDGSSIFDKNNTLININIICISEFILENEIKDIDLIKINTEGAEYEIIDDLYSSGLISSVKNFQIQFHNFVDNAEGQLAEARKKLAITHKQDWNFEFIWEGWSIK